MNLKDFICGYCEKIFKRKYDLARHIHQRHKFLEEPLVKSESHNFICAECSRHFKKKYSLKRHVQIIHSPRNHTLFLLFASIQEFNAWKRNEELQSVSQFVQHRGAKKNSCTTRMQFYCHRSGTYRCKGRGERALKTIGSQKIGASCSACMYITVNRVDGSVSCRYCKIHSHHLK